jgi:hypothetical protein
MGAVQGMRPMVARPSNSYAKYLGRCRPQHLAQPVITEIKAHERVELLGIRIRNRREIAAQQHPARQSQFA